MVYRSSMMRGLAVLLLSAAAAPIGEAASQDAPVPLPQAPAESAVTAVDTPPATTDPPPATTDTPPATTDTPPASTPGTSPPDAGADANVVPLDERMEAYDQFRAMYETARFEEALPFAQRVVELSETAGGSELPIAYNNLGATQLKLGDYAAAEVSYRKSLELLESTQGISSRRLIVPLAGLGAVYAALDQHAMAAENFDRALAVSRRADGLFNLSQLPLIEQAAGSRFAIQDFSGVERERLYEIKILEQNYGYADPRSLPAILKLAAFYESLREYPAARMMYLRARDISFKESGGLDPMAIKSLVGIARTHRLQYTLDPDTLGNQQMARDEVTGEISGRVYRDTRVPQPSADRTGLKSAETALEILRASSDPPRQLLTDTLIELGDWYQVTSRPAVSLPYYVEAAKILAAEPESAGLGNPLLVPRMVFYRPPLASSRSMNSPAGQYVVRKTEFKLAVSATGEPENITVTITDMSDGQLSQSRRALSRAIYSPRFVDGKAVATDDVTFTAEWYEVRDSAKATAAPASSAGN